MVVFEPGLLARLTAIALLGVLLQLSMVSQLPILGVAADLSPLMVVAAGFLLGSITGACFGFAVGLMIDTALVQTLGVTSLLLVAVGYGAGRLRELRDPAHGLIPLALGAIATGVTVTGFSVMQFLLGAESPVSLVLVKQILLTILVNSAIAVPVHHTVRRILLPYLPEDPRRRRRRAYTTGGLSPLSRA